MSDSEIIERIAARGDGITASGRHVAGAVPGDAVAADGTLVAGPHHVTPPCRHFPECGGCQLQQADETALRQFVTDRVVHAAEGQGIAIGEVLPTLSRRSLVVVISDFLDETDALISALARFRHARHELILFHVVAPEEVDFPFSRPTQFHDLEQSSRRMLVDPHRVRERYLHHFTRFCTRLEQGAAGQDVDYQRVTTRQPYVTALGRYLASRSRRRRGR